MIGEADKQQRREKYFVKVRKQIHKPTLVHTPKPAYKRSKVKQELEQILEEELNDSR